MKVATFTLDGGSLAIGMGPPAEQVASVIDEEREHRPCMKPAAMTLVRNGDERISVSDVSAARSNSDLAAQIWLRRK